MWENAGESMGETSPTYPKITYIIVSTCGEFFVRPDDSIWIRPADRSHSKRPPDHFRTKAQAVNRVDMNTEQGPKSTKIT